MIIGERRLVLAVSVGARLPSGDEGSVGGLCSKRVWVFPLPSKAGFMTLYKPYLYMRHCVGIMARSDLIQNQKE